jgi:hypothetical protein
MADDHWSHKTAEIFKETLGLDINEARPYKNTLSGEIRYITLGEILFSGRFDDWVRIEETQAVKALYATPVSNNE